MSTLYEVSVRTLENDTTAVLDLRVVHPDSMHIWDSPGFALMLLWEGTDGHGPLATEVDLETALDEGWMRRYAQGFVADVELVELENEPPVEARRDYDHAYWAHAEGWLRGALRIRVTDPAWISHLSEGQNWDSAAYEANDDFDTCEPIRFEVQVPATDNALPAASREGLIPVPRVFALEYLNQAKDDYIWFPKYSYKAYVADEVFEGEQVTRELLDSLVGQVVWFDNWGEDVGVLMPDDTVVRISSGSRGSTGFGPGRGKIGPARFNTKKKRLADPLTIAGLARSADPTVVDAVVDGCAVTLTVHSYDAGRELGLQHAGDALALVGAAEYETFNGFANATSTLGTFLRTQAEARGIEFARDIFPQLGGGMIVEWTVAKTKDAEEVDFDALADDDLLAKLRENPWDTWTIRVVTTDPAWVAHLPSMTPFPYGFHWVADAAPWETAPLTAGAET